MNITIANQISPCKSFNIRLPPSIHSWLSFKTTAKKKIIFWQFGLRKELSSILIKNIWTTFTCKDVSILARNSQMQNIHLACNFLHCLPDIVMQQVERQVKSKNGGLKVETAITSTGHQIVSHSLLCLVLIKK